MIVRDALRAARDRLAGVSDTPQLDAELLMAHALAMPREHMLLDHLADTTPERFDSLLDRRLGHEPLAYIVGHREFWSLEFAVGPGVLIPRPDSETLIEAAVSVLAETQPRSILDLGTGSGALLLAALYEWPEAHGLGVDNSDTALGYARRNAETLGLAGRAEFRRGDWGSGIDGRFDLILCNPPYVAPEETLMPDVADFEPESALFAAEGGLADSRRLIPQLPGMMAQDGIACFELGAGQFPAVSAIVAEYGLKSAVYRDLAGHERCLLIHS